MLEILAQTPPALPDTAWWQDYGPLGIVALIVAAAVVTYLWFVHFPHARAVQRLELRHREKKQELETERDGKLNIFIDKLSETHSVEVEFKRQIAEACTNMARTQASHASDCSRTLHSVQAIEKELRNR